MKKRKTLVISVLLAAALVLGIGYAGFTSTITIGGDAILNSTADSQVLITNIEVVDTTIAADDTTPIELVLNTPLPTKTADVDLKGFSSTQDSITIEVTISNHHEFPVTLTAPTIHAENNDITGGGEYFNIELLNASSIPTEIGKATYVGGVLTPTSITFQYKVSVATVTADAHTVSYTITTSASSR